MLSACNTILPSCCQVWGTWLIPLTDVYSDLPDIFISVLSHASTMIQVFLCVCYCCRWGAGRKSKAEHQGQVCRLPGQSRATKDLPEGEGEKSSSQTCQGVPVWWQRVRLVNKSVGWVGYSVRFWALFNRLSNFLEKIDVVSYLLLIIGEMQRKDWIKFIISKIIYNYLMSQHVNMYLLLKNLYCQSCFKGCHTVDVFAYSADLRCTDY